MDVLKPHRFKYFAQLAQNPIILSKEIDNLENISMNMITNYIATYLFKIIQCNVIFINYHTYVITFSLRVLDMCHHCPITQSWVEHELS